MLKNKCDQTEPERLPDFQTQILNNGVEISLSETDGEMNLNISDLYLVKDIDDVIAVHDILEQIIENYLNITEPTEECTDEDDCSECDECVGPCYAN